MKILTEKKINQGRIEFWRGDEHVAVINVLGKKLVSWHLSFGSGFVSSIEEARAVILEELSDG